MASCKQFCVASFGAYVGRMRSTRRRTRRIPFLGNEMAASVCAVGAHHCGAAQRSVFARWKK